jgi:hypothetical protein
LRHERVSVRHSTSEARKAALEWFFRTVREGQLVGLPGCIQCQVLNLILFLKKMTER